MDSVTDAPICRPDTTKEGTLFELAKLFLCSDNLLHILFHFRNINMFKLIADINAVS